MASPRIFWTKLNAAGYRSYGSVCIEVNSSRDFGVIWSGDQGVIWSCGRKGVIVVWTISCKLATTTRDTQSPRAALLIIAPPTVHRRAPAQPPLSISRILAAANHRADRGTPEVHRCYPKQPFSLRLYFCDPPSPRFQQYTFASPD